MLLFYCKVIHTRSYEKYTYNEGIELTSSTAHRGIPKFCFDGSHGRYLSDVVFLRKVDENIAVSGGFVIVNNLKKSIISAWIIIHQNIG